jgi:predicted AlkP superfamily pyrophosphatase or phosphodiesterase
MTHFDLCGTFPIPSFIGSWYFLFFINDYNRKTWAYFLKEKKFKVWKFQSFQSASKNGEENIITLKTNRRGVIHVPWIFILHRKTWYSQTTYYNRFPTLEWSCRKEKSHHCGKTKEHVHWE